MTAKVQLRICLGHRMDGCSHHYAVRAVAFSPDGTKLISGSEDHTAQLWNAEDGKPLLWNEATGAPLVLPHQDSVQAVAFSPDGQRVMTGSFDRTAQLWDVETGRAIDPPLAHPGAVGTVAFGPGGLFLTAARDGMARVWSRAEEKAWRHKFRHNDYVMAVALSPDGRLAVTGSGHEAVMWNTETGQRLGPLPVAAATPTAAIRTMSGRWHSAPMAVRWCRPAAMVPRAGGRRRVGGRDSMPSVGRASSNWVITDGQRPSTPKGNSFSREAETPWEKNSRERLSSGTATTIRRAVKP